MPHPVFIVGPTCVGKSSVAIGLAKKINAEIVSCDSMQVYKGMDIGTAKPTQQERSEVPHHMIDIVDITHEYNVAEYVRDAGMVIEDIQKKGKTPLVVGGTGLYLKALIDGLFTGPKGDNGIRMRLDKERVEELYNELKNIDPISAERIKPNDKRRIIRALEVYYLTGRPISSFQTQWRTKRDAFIIGLNREREDLYSKIDQRVEQMFQAGLVDEVKELVKLGLRENKTACQALGYKEVLGYIDGRYGLEEVKGLVKRNTRHFSKRQLTWFKKDDRVRWILIQEKEGIEGIVERILEWRGKEVQ